MPNDVPPPAGDPDPFRLTPEEIEEARRHGPDSSGWPDGWVPIRGPFAELEGQAGQGGGRATDDRGGPGPAGAPPGGRP